MITCRLLDILDALGFQLENPRYYLDTDTGEIVMISDEEFHAVEGEESIESYPEWHRELITVAGLVPEGKQGRFLRLPTLFDINEYSMMERFSRNYP